MTPERVKVLRAAIVLGCIVGCVLILLAGGIAIVLERFG